MADAPNDFAALARQYMEFWGDALRGASPQTAPDMGMPGMRETLDAWMRQQKDAGLETELKATERQGRANRDRQRRGGNR